MKRAAAAVLLGLAVFAAAGCGGSRHQHASAKPPGPLTGRIVACQRAGKVICNRAAYRKDRGPFARPDPKGAHLLKLRQVWPAAKTAARVGAELMTYGQAKRIAPGLAAGSRAVVDPSRMVWVVTVYRARTESQVHDAVTGAAIDSCVNCSAIPATVRYRSESLTLKAGPPGYRPAVPRSRVMTLYRSWPAGPKLKGTPTIQLRMVNDGNPNPSAHDYPGWVVTFAHTKPTSYGPASGSQKADCARVAVYDLRTRAWTENFQSCPQRTRPSCDAACTPANQPALDAAANYAEQVAGAAHCYAGSAVDDPANKVIVYLVHAPASVLDALHARHPGIYVIRSAPRTLRDIVTLQNSIDWSLWKLRGIHIVSTGPTETGYLQIGVTTNIAKAQAAFDEQYGRGVIRVVKGQIAWSA